MEKKSPVTGNDEPVAETAKREQLVYIGPNIPGGELHQNQTYSEIPGYMTCIKKCPLIRNLFVPWRQFGAANRALASAGTPEHTLFREVAAALAKGGK